MRACKIFLICVLLIASQPALADCVINGVSYPEGTESNGYICKNGEWVGL